jgi:hypothetical protein
VPLLLGSRTQQEWLSVAHLGKGTRRAKPPARAAKTAQLGTSPAVQRTLALVVALLLLISGGVALRRFAPDTKVGKTFDPLAIPKHPGPPPPSAAPAPAPTEVAAPAPPATPSPTSTPHRRSPRSSVEVAAPVAPPATTPAPTQAASPPPATSPAPAPAPEQPPAPSSPPPQTPAPPPPAPPAPPAPQPTAAAAKASVGQGDSGAVVAMSVPNDPAKNPQPDVDLTVGHNQVVGNAPPSDGTGVSVSVTPSLQTVRDTVHDTVHDTVRAMKHRLQLEGSAAGPVDRAPLRQHFHTASARAAAFPGLQPEIEAFSGRTLPTLWTAPPGGP